MIACAAIGALLCGCAARHAPSGWLPYAQETQREAYGGWIHLEYRAGLGFDGEGDPRDVSGELVTISEDSVFVLTGRTLTARALTSVPRATLEVYDSRSGDVARMTLGGTLATVTHGFGLVLTAPLWILTGCLSSAALSNQGRLTVDSSRVAMSAQRAGRTVWGRASWKDLSRFARFPQGFPPGLDRALLHERPRTKREHRTQSWPGPITEH